MTDSEQFAHELAPILEECCAGIFREAVERFDDRWVKVYYDHRFVDFSANANGGGGVLFKDGAKSLDFLAPDDVGTLLFIDVTSLRNRFRDIAWYGILFQISKDGEVEITYDHDPACCARLTRDQRAGKPF